jgi:hypothetical protein
LAAVFHLWANLLAHLEGAAAILGEFSL